MKKNDHDCWQKGYTLVEIMVVVSAVGLIMTAMIGVILSGFKAQNRTKSDSKVAENGSWIIKELRNNIFNSKILECGEDGKSVQIESINDGKITTLSCDQVTKKIASTSATEKELNSDEVEVVDCNDFVICEDSGVVFKFSLGPTTNGVGSSQVFSTKVTLRN